MKRLPLKKNYFLHYYFRDNKNGDIYHFYSRYNIDIELMQEKEWYHIINYHNIYWEQNEYLPLDRYTLIHIDFEKQA